jgi:hypothetical protein
MKRSLRPPRAFNGGQTVADFVLHCCCQSTVPSYSYIRERSRSHLRDSGESFEKDSYTVP